jgi:uncharacterized delta-60 repeat protein
MLDLSTDGRDDWATAVAVQPDGKIVTVGTCSGVTTSYDACVARFNANGTPDTTFDGDGVRQTLMAQTDELSSVALQDDGRILAFGRCYIAASGNDACAMRFRPDGAPDTTFDGDGVLTVALAPGTNDEFSYSSAMQLRPDGRVIAAGACDMGATGIDACLVALDQGGAIQQYQDTVSDWDTSGTSAFGACLSSVGAGATNQWAVGAACPATDGAYWNDVPTAPEKIAYTTVSGTSGALANLRFGLRTGAAQKPGSYVAPITFDVLAPNA